MVRFWMILILAGVCVPSISVQAAEEAEEQAVREALRILQDRFNVRDKLSLVGEVDFEYRYVPEDRTRRAGVYTVARLAGLYTEPEPTIPDTGQVSSAESTSSDTGWMAAQVSVLADTGGALTAPEEVLPPARTLEEALQALPAAIRDTLVLRHPPEEQRKLLEWMGRLQPASPPAGPSTAPTEPAEPVREELPELLGADAQQLIGRNRRAEEEGLVLVLRRPPPNHQYREDITVAAQEYSMAERRLLCWDLDYLFESVPPEVSLFMTPTAISIQGTQAEVTVACEFRSMADTPLSAPYVGRGGTLILRWRRSGEEWRLEQVRAFVDQIRATAGLQG